MRSTTIAAAFCLVATIAISQVGVWEEAAALRDPRAYLSAATVDGQIYTVGGLRTWPPLSSVEVYDPSRDAWSERQPLPVPRMALAVVGLAGRLYAIGGADRTAWIDRVDVYDPAADRWTERSPLPAARGYAGAAAAFGRLYIIGGWNGIHATSQVDRYDPVADEWTRVADLPTPRAGGAACAVRGKVYVVGGWNPGGDGFGPLTDSLLEYDPLTDVWLQRAPMPAPLELLSAVSVGGGCTPSGAGTPGETPSPRLRRSTSTTPSQTRGHQSPLFQMRAWLSLRRGSVP